MKHLKHKNEFFKKNDIIKKLKDKIKLTNESAQEEDEPEIKTPSIEDYPQSVKLIYKRFNPVARKSINDNVEKFAKLAKRVFYYEAKSWKDYFNNKEVKKLNTLTDVLQSLEEWMK